MYRSPHGAVGKRLTIDTMVMGSILCGGVNYFNFSTLIRLGTGLHSLVYNATNSSEMRKAECLNSRLFLTLLVCPPPRRLTFFYSFSAIKWQKKNRKMFKFLI